MEDDDEAGGDECAECGHVLTPDEVDEAWHESGSGWVCPSCGEGNWAD